MQTYKRNVQKSYLQLVEDESGTIEEYSFNLPKNPVSFNSSGRTSTSSNNSNDSLPREDSNSFQSPKSPSKEDSTSSNRSRKSGVQVHSSKNQKHQSLDGDARIGEM